MFFSVIVPVYKVEKYIFDCIESVLNQTFSDFELILVDDGSPDRCPQICDEYKEKDALLTDIIEFVHRIDNVGFLQQEDFDRVQEIAKLYYEKEDGEKILFHDKKSETDSINYVIITEIGKCEILKLKKEENLLWKY